MASINAPFNGRHVWNAADHGGPELYLGMELGEQEVKYGPHPDDITRVPEGMVIAFCWFRDEIPAGYRALGDDGRALWAFVALVSAELRDEGNYLVGLIDRYGTVSDRQHKRNLVEAARLYTDEYGADI